MTRKSQLEIFYYFVLVCYTFCQDYSLRDKGNSFISGPSEMYDRNFVLLTIGWVIN